MKLHGLPAHPFTGKVLVCIPGAPPTFLRVRGADWNEQNQSLTIGVDLPGENAKQSKDPAAEEPLAIIGQGVRERRVMP